MPPRLAKADVDSAVCTVPQKNFRSTDRDTTGGILAFATADAHVSAPSIKPCFRPSNLSSQAKGAGFRFNAFISPPNVPAGSKVELRPERAAILLRSQRKMPSSTSWTLCNSSQNEMFTAEPGKPLAEARGEIAGALMKALMSVK